MRNFTVTVDADGKVDLLQSFVGYSGEHNSVELQVTFTEDGSAVYGAADYFRIVIDGIYSNKLYSKENSIYYLLPQEVMKPPEIHCQLIGYGETAGEISEIIKSEIFGFTVDKSEVSLIKVQGSPDTFEVAMAVCEESAESARKSAELAERAAKILDMNNLANSFKGKSSGRTVELTDISPLVHDIKIQLTGNTVSDFSAVTVTVTDQYGTKHPYTADSNGSLTVNSIYPYMFFATGNDEIFIEVEYNRDTNEVLNEIDNLNVDVSKTGGIVTVSVTGRDGVQNSVEVLDGEKGEKGDKGDKGDDAVTDQIYDPESENAQSGKAVAEAIETNSLASAIIQTTPLAASLNITDSSDKPMVSLKVIGKTFQDGTPSPDSPQPIQCVKKGTKINIANDDMSVVQEITVPCDLYEGDIWYPMSGKVERYNEILSIGNDFNYLSYTAHPSFICPIVNKTKGFGASFKSQCFRGMNYPYSNPNTDWRVGTSTDRKDIYLTADSTVTTIEQLLERIGTDKYVVYPIETPIIEQYEPYPKLYTNKLITNIFNSEATELNADIEAQYITDTKTYIDDRFTALTQAIISLGGNV